MGDCFGFGGLKFWPCKQSVWFSVFEPRSAQTQAGSMQGFSGIDAGDPQKHSGQLGSPLNATLH